jgi:hypothetical protein
MTTAPNKYISYYPAEGVVFHWNFAKLQLNSLALRGVLQNSNCVMFWSLQRQQFAKVAVSFALDTLKFVLESPSMRNSVVGVPLYLHTSITFAAVFLLKVGLQLKETGLSALDLPLSFGLLNRIIDLLSQSKSGERHLANHISQGLKKMSLKFQHLHERTEAMSFESRHRTNSLAYAASTSTVTDRYDKRQLCDASIDTATLGSGQDLELSQSSIELSELSTEYFPSGFYAMLNSQIPL